MKSASAATGSKKRTCVRWKNREDETIDLKMLGNAGNARESRMLEEPRRMLYLSLAASIERELVHSDRVMGGKSSAT
jgi:hypothetical protein